MNALDSWVHEANSCSRYLHRAGPVRRGTDIASAMQNVRLKTGPLNYLFMHTGESGAYCLGVFDNGASGTLLGGISFRNILVQYDRRNRRVGFGQASCQEIGLMHAACPPGFSREEG